jgi:hypothetical protein
MLGTLRCVGGLNRWAFVGFMAQFTKIGLLDPQSSIPRDTWPSAGIEADPTVKMARWWNRTVEIVEVSQL